MFKNLIRKAFGDPGEREAKRLKPVVDQINALAAEFEGMSDDELRGQTDAFRATIAERVGTLRDDLALAREEWLQSRRQRSESVAAGSPAFGEGAAPG